METGRALSEVELLRARWRQWREGQGLADPASDSFAEGGLGRLLPEVSARLVLLPPDPETHLVEFDSEMWAWWGEEFHDPSSSGSTHWGVTRLPTAAAAVHGSHWNGEWPRYLAIHRHGGIEMGLGRDAGFERDGRRYFFLVQLVARCWAALARFETVVERFSLSGDFELSLALRSTAGASLADMAQGWAEPGTSFDPDPTCPERHLLLRRELPSWGSGTDSTRALAFSLGAQIEDAWGVNQRRFIAGAGDRSGEFDSSRVRWH